MKSLTLLKLLTLTPIYPPLFLLFRTLPYLVNRTEILTQLKSTSTISRQILFRNRYLCTGKTWEVRILPESHTVTLSWPHFMLLFPISTSNPAVTLLRQDVCRTLVEPVPSHSCPLEWGSTRLCRNTRGFSDMQLTAKMTSHGSHFWNCISERIPAC